MSKPTADHVDRVFKSIRGEQTQFDSSEFFDCEFQDCSFAESVFRGCRFINCTFEDCDLSLVQLPGSTFSSVRFLNSRLIGVDWTQVDWARTRLGDPINFFNCAIRHSTFLGLSLQGIQVRDCTALDVDFREADLSRANLSGTDLAKSLFFNTNLTEADLSGARNYQIAPGKNVLTRAKFSLPEAMALLNGLDIILSEE